MEFVVVAASDKGATLRLDYRAFAYAGKFVVGSTGKAALYTPDGSPAAPGWEPERPLPDGVDADAFERDVVAAVSFSPDRTDPDRCRLRYITVHAACRGAGVGPELIARTVAWLADTGYDRVRIAVNNPFAYEACYKCGFAYTGETTGLAELELERPTDRPAAARDDRGTYLSGIVAFRDRDADRTEAERRFLVSRIGERQPDGERLPDDEQRLDGERQPADANDADGDLGSTGPPALIDLVEWD